MRYLSSISIYETPTHFYVIGSDLSETKFCTLKIDRQHDTKFAVGEPDHYYSKSDIGELLATVSYSSIVTPSEKWGQRKNQNPGLIRTLDKAYGIIGAVRFLEGYYLLVVTKVRQAAAIGHHVIYKVEDVSMIYLPACGAPISADEHKYSKLFQSVDITTDFYFSYTYDLSRNLQENVLMNRSQSFNKNNYSPGTRSEPKFVWNEYLLQPFRQNAVSDKWTLELVHGFVAFQQVELPCARLNIVLMARRSSKYAGTRFLKRGTNFEGDVANDVETEQLVWDMNSSPDLRTGKFCSFVQRRGSVPLFWSQDPATRGVVGKPPIYVDLVEPHALTTAAHFRELRRKYAHPVIVVNLVKRREKRHHENLLHEQFLKTVRYLNEFRQPGRKIDYISLDVAKCNKSGMVMPKLEQLALKTVQRTGWFQSFPQLKAHQIRPNPLLSAYKPTYSQDGQLILQHGVIRTNCVDCLDRTNVAQYGIGRVAMGFQLYALGYMDEPLLPPNGDLCRALEELYDDHGDTLALQYAGSQLVHSIKTYKKTSAFQERSRDVIQTLSRYYSNTFNDFEKQNGINLFLGIFRPFERAGLPHLWDLGSDRYIHFPATFCRRRVFEPLQWALNVTSDTEDESEEWLEDWLQTQAHHAAIDLNNDFARPRAQGQNRFAAPGHHQPPPPDPFDDVHRTFEMTSFDHLLKDPTQRKTLQLAGLAQSAGPSGGFMKLFKSSEPAPRNLSEEEEEDEADFAQPEDEDLKFEQDLNEPGAAPAPHSSRSNASPAPGAAPPTTPRLTLAAGLADPGRLYAFHGHKPISPADMAKYEKYVQLGQQTRTHAATAGNGSLRSFSKLPPIFQFRPLFYTVDSVFSTELDDIPEKSMRMYEEAAKLHRGFTPPTKAQALYEQYDRITHQTLPNRVETSTDGG